MKINPLQFAKAIIGGLALAITALTPTYGRESWFVSLTAIYGALAIYFAVNQPPSQPPAQQ